MHTEGFSERVYCDAEPSQLTKSQIDELAQKIAKMVDYTPGGDLEPIVTRLGGTIRSRGASDEDETGSIRVHGPNSFTIYTSPYIGERRRRFTIAHELGHYFLHSGSGTKRIIVKREGSNRVEWEANWFASGFLMPRDCFRRKMEETKNSGRLADYFKVSEAAAEIRMEALEG